MDLNDALSTINSLKGRYQAFEKIEEVLALAAASEATVGDLKRQAATLQKQVEDLKTRYDKAQEDIEEAEAELLAAVKARDNASQEARQALQKAREALLEQSQAMEQELVEKRAAHNDAMIDLKNLYLDRKETLDGEIQALEAKRDSILATLTNIKVGVSG
jgi:chromosome segregation ATPase